MEQTLWMCDHMRVKELNGRQGGEVTSSLRTSTSSISWIPKHPGAPRAPDPETHDAQIPVLQLPRCEQTGCHGLLRPAVVWFGETLDSDVLTRAEKVLDSCDLCLVVGTSSIVYPAAMFAPQVAARGVPVAEFNMEDTPATMRFKFHFHGPCGSTLPAALARHEMETH
ncbi:NAD-dependent protein deacylase sirtuin-5, mitochondrial-like [Limanda limanda]|uniref:NAD-dependent protein deacylase sirtuin-5, mitochondrial-like n=1 Tax=Limanda limanda TaxID=27771 RepID=UPI0029C794FF|nr:NAD-dependent protein deacylase sirtuin-5, mitochondrial-like [Limanda limanda]